MSKKPEQWSASRFTVQDDTGDPFSIVVTGRDRWALEEMIRAGAHGCTPIDHPGPRWSADVFKLRGLGVRIETTHEAHGGPFKGTHARYVLRSTLTAAPDAGRGVAA